MGSVRTGVRTGRVIRQSRVFVEYFAQCLAGTRLASTRTPRIHSFGVGDVEEIGGLGLKLAVSRDWERSVLQNNETSLGETQVLHHLGMEQYTGE